MITIEEQVKKFLKFEDVDIGEVFRLEDDDTLYLKVESLW